MLRIWGRANSMNVQKVMWTVAELGLEAERVDAGMHHGVVGEDWFGTLNPSRTIPVIDDDGFILWESNAIIRYLSAKHATGTLMPAELHRRASLDMWMDWQQTVIMPGLGPVFLGLIRTPASQRDEVAIRQGAELVARAMVILDDQLSGKHFVLGSEFTAADIPLGCAACRWYALDVPHPELRSLRNWMDRLEQRPAFAAHVMLPLC